MELRQPHDALFKEIFGKIETAVDFLQTYPPPEVVACLKLNEVELQKETFIDPNLQEQYSDLLYRAPITDTGAAFVYILFEHKSNPDNLTPFQLLRYMVRIWERSLRLDPRAAFPPILPIVFYHGHTP